MKKYYFLILMVFFLLISTAEADTVVTKDGEQYYGKILSQDSKKVVLELKIGIMKFPREEVDSIEFTPPTVTSSEVSGEAVSAPTEKPMQPKPTAQKPVRQIIPWKPAQRTPEQEEMLKREAETYKKLDEMQKAKELKKQEELRKKELEEEKKKAVRPAETPSKKKIEIKKEEKKEAIPTNQPTEIKPAIRGLDSNRYKTY